MSSEAIQSLTGFRDFHPEACAARNYLFHHWRETARRYGFVEYEGPVLEPTELYQRKSGDEIVRQLFHFEDQGGRAVALRPETTPTLARMAAARQRHYPKPMKWFQIGSCFRYEKPQKGRGREFYQFNCDILGDRTAAGTAELIALAIDTMRALGFTAADFQVRLSDRNVWLDFLSRENLDASAAPDLLQVVDKLDREKPEVTETRLAALGTSTAAVRRFIEGGAAGFAPLEEVRELIAARGLGDFVRIDPGIVRGLAYYTGTVFEVFDASHSLRAVAGGGRYDNLCQLIGGVDLPAAGFAMGDMVVGEFIRATPHAASRLDAWLHSTGKPDAYVVIADESRRSQALALAQSLRDSGLAIEYPFSPQKVGKQFQTAESLGARAAIVIGSEFPEVRIKELRSRSEITTDAASATRLRTLLASPPFPPLTADS